jgi:hypothetical protein
MARYLTIVFIVNFDFDLLCQKPSMSAIACCAIVVFCFVLGNQQESRWSLIGVIFGVTSSFFVAMNAIYVRRSLPASTISPGKSHCIKFLTPPSSSSLSSLSPAKSRSSLNLLSSAPLTSGCSCASAVCFEFPSHSRRQPRSSRPRLSPTMSPQLKRPQRRQSLPL